MVAVSMTLFYYSMGYENIKAFNYLIVNSLEWLGNPFIDKAFNTNFLRIGLMEELFKLYMFLLVAGILGRKGKKRNHPVANMFYFALVGMGFGVIENASYIYSRSMDIYLLRSTFPILLHMICGLFAGYWIALGEMKPSFKDETYFGLLFKKYPKYKRGIFIIIALISATFTHGLYNFSATIFPGQAYPILMIILSTGITGAYFGAIHINQLAKSRVIINPEKRNQTRLL